MKRSSLRKAIALFLGVFLVLGMTLSAVQAGEMAVQMVAMDSSDTMSPSGCNGCGDGDADLAGTCLPMCMGASAALLPSDDIMMVLENSASLYPNSTISHERVFSPDPHPPKSNDLG
jgi:hypothetical protein